MQNPYNPKELVLKLKARGLDIAEESAKVLAEEVFSFLDESARLSPTPYDDMLLIILPMIKEKAMEAIDKIDGTIGA